MYPCLISSEPEEWLHRIQKVRGKGITNGDRIALMDHARNYSWSSVASQTFQLLSHDIYSGGHSG